jgi:hypothetical protein
MRLRSGRIIRTTPIAPASAPPPVRNTQSNKVNHIDFASYCSKTMDEWNRIIITKQVTALPNTPEYIIQNRKLWTEIARCITPMYCLMNYKFDEVSQNYACLIEPYKKFAESCLAEINKVPREEGKSRTIFNDCIRCLALFIENANTKSD